MTSRARNDQAKAERRRLLLAAALDEFYEKGVSAARTDDIAARAGLSKGTLYLYFPSKDDLFQALIESLTLPNLEQIEAMANAAPSVMQAIGGFVVLAPKIIRGTDLPRLMKVIIGESQTYPDVINRYRTEVLDRMLGIFSGVLAAAKARGEIDIGSPEVTAKLIMAPVFLSGLWVAVFEAGRHETLDIEALLKAHAEFLMKAMKP